MRLVLAGLAGAGALLALAAPGGADTRYPCPLRLELGRPTQSPPGQFHADLVLVADGERCRLSGSPEVELIGPADATFGSLYELPAQPLHRPAVTLQSGRSAHAVLTWLRGGTWTPGYVRVVVRTNDTPGLPMAIPWRYGPVLRQDAATHPGTYVGPIEPGS